MATATDTSVGTTDVQVDDLPNYTQTTVEDTINAGSLADARAIVERLADASNP